MKITMEYIKAPMKGTPMARRRYGLHTVNGFGSLGFCSEEYLRKDPFRVRGVRHVRVEREPRDLRRGIYGRGKDIVPEDFRVG